MIYSMIMCSLVIAGFKLIEQTFLYNEDICNVMCRLNWADIIVLVFSVNELNS